MMNTNKKGLPAGALIGSSTTSQIPVVPTVTCGSCATPWNRAALRVRTGRCTCGAWLACGDCGAPMHRHFDGWNGNPLSCSAVADAAA